MHSLLGDWQSSVVRELITHIFMRNFLSLFYTFFESLSCISSKNNAYFVFECKELDKEELKHKLKISSKMWQCSHAAYPPSRFSLCQPSI